MSEFRRSATARLEAGEATWRGWSSATDEADTQLDQGRMISEIEMDEIGSYSHYRVSRSDADSGESLPFAMHGAVPNDDYLPRQQADDYYRLNGSPKPGSDSSSTQAAGCARQIPEKLACRFAILDSTEGDEQTDFEPVADLTSLPALNFKPIILREWTLIVIAIFYSGLITGVGVLYYYENRARIFHVHTMASRFTIRILPTLIGSVSALLFQSVLINFARILPYINMARPTRLGDEGATGAQTLCAQVFPLLNVFDAFQNRNYALTAMIVIQLYVNPFITPAKSLLIRRKASEDDSELWTISISGGAAQYLMFNYSILFVIVLGLLFYLWNRRTGLKWDPVSLADHMMLVQGSNVLEDFRGLEYRSQTLSDRVLRGENRFTGLKKKRYRLGYWRHRPTNQYWHGIRKWPPSSSLLPDQEHDSKTQSAPRLADQSPEALNWWKKKCAAVLKKPNKCYSNLYLLISDYAALITYIVVVALAAVCLYSILTDLPREGFTLDSGYPQVILSFLPTFFLGLMNGYWFQIDVWYRQLQPYMGLRQPSPATENLLLGYPSDLPVVITMRALANGHWRLALTSVMPLVQRALPILAGSLLSVDTTDMKNSGRFQVNIAAVPFKAVTGMLCAYVVLIPFVWPGLNRRLPFVPVCIADHIVVYYDSTLVRKDAFIPRRLNEQRWHMKYRLCLEERRYGFGIYEGRYGAIHIGMDDVYGHSSDEMGFRFVAPLKPPIRRYRQWLKNVWIGSAKKLSIKRQPTLREEELQALERLQTTLQEGERLERRSDHDVAGSTSVSDQARHYTELSHANI